MTLFLGISAPDAEADTPNVDAADVLALGRIVRKLQKGAIATPGEKGVRISRLTVRTVLDPEWKDKFTGTCADVTKTLIKYLSSGEQEPVYTYAA